MKHIPAETWVSVKAQKTPPHHTHKQFLFENKRPGQDYPGKKGPKFWNLQFVFDHFCHFIPPPAQKSAWHDCRLLQCPPLEIEGVRNPSQVGKNLELYDLSMDYSHARSSMVCLNIGGKKFCTTVDTLTHREPDSMLAAMFSGQHTVCTDLDKGYVFVDRDGKHFRHILNWLRDGDVPILKEYEYLELLREAEYFQLVGLIDGIKSALSKKKEDEDLGTEMTRLDIIKCIQFERVRFRGVNLSGLDLSKLDLSFVDFSYACLKNVFFSRANLQCAKFKDVDAEASIFHNATLRECEFTGANLRASLLAGANLQSANLQDACLIDSSLCGADLRSAHLQTADLTNANLEGANLEGANLKGAKLTNANLRGANLQRAYLRHVNLCNTHLEGAKLDGANLVGAIR